MGAEDGAFTQDFLDGRLDSMRKAAGALERLVCEAPPCAPALQIAVQLLTFCVAPKGDHLLRHLPPRVTARFGSQVDQLLLETFNNLVSLKVTPAQAEQVQMRVPDGGMGLRARSGPQAAAAYLGSWALCAAGVAEATGISLVALPALFADLTAAALQVAEAGGQAAASLVTPQGWQDWLDDPAEKVQRMLSRQVHAASRQRWLAAASVEAVAGLHTASGWGAGAA